MIKDPKLQQSQWRPQLLVTLLFLSALFWFSWQWEPTREWWDNLDKLVFFTLNGWIADSTNAQVFWGLANNRLADSVPGLLLIGLFLIYAFSHQRAFLVERAALFLFMILYIPIVMLLFKKSILLDFDRQSPSLILEPVYRLSELAAWTKPKDASGNSFPGDHSTVMVFWTGFLIYFAGWRIGMASFIVALLFVLPRMVSGAHWATDVIVGAGTIAFLGLSFGLGSPLVGKIINKLYKPTEKLLKLFRLT